MTPQLHQLAIDETPTVIDFDPSKMATSKMASLSLEETLEELSLEGDLTICMTPQLHELAIDETPTVIDFDPSKMASLSIEETPEELSLEGDLTICTEDESDWSLQAGNHFSHLKNIDQPTRQRSILKTGFTTEAQQVLDLSTHKEEPTFTPQEEEPITKRRRSSVSFHEINLRYYDQTIGDHPSTSYGPPIALDWHYEEAEPIHIDEYEEHRGSRRTLRQLMINCYTRKNLLRWTYGHTEEELEKATKASNKASFQRGVTKYFLPIMKVEEVVQSAARKTRRAVVFNKKLSRTTTI